MKRGTQFGHDLFLFYIAFYDEKTCLLQLIRHIWRVMKISAQLTDEALLQEVGGRMAALRLERNLTQAALAEEAGVSKRTVERLETGAVATQLSSLLRVCRVLGMVERFETLLPEPVPSPMAQLKQAGRKRQRASGKNESLAKPGTWEWGHPT